MPAGGGGLYRWVSSGVDQRRGAPGAGEGWRTVVAAGRADAGRRTRTWTGCQRQESQPCRAAAVRGGRWVTVARVPDFVDEGSMLDWLWLVIDDSKFLVGVVFFFYTN